ncbi:hypothetical protein [Salimicrobium flavidum]|uniref:PH domain-containing protein n=1 Tax=Salimicrobium flavidum TaxID=570947 RepID=A0A1N7J9C6_9BACI|nr:hypothetical protein [Salimicrobium flavidum]SIS45836.1 hypothetical protein SAMN05421687_104180 [Salimicrobium flavidum]
MRYGITMFSSVLLPAFIILFIILSIRDGVGYVFAALLLFVIYAMSTGITVEEDQVVQHVLLFRKSIHRRVLKPEDIEKIVFFHLGGSNGKAVIHTCEGKNMQVTESNYEIMAYLERFSLHHNITAEYGEEYRQH